ncbi:BLUF domain-containing protein [Xenophilus arseniciresistens]|uniref:BLUF domain-containing protein n=1 Tax=Xenophilus arseniciresistens TaxID=1283306 RepID=A0AAE3N8L3_9BURK|nr:BLUF domain-containing protein [Xenophilus arseniciresistens]MDA7416351.1 BLUF domain-containing protein [Xenophilus arseniciresistens]
MSIKTVLYVSRAQRHRAPRHLQALIPLARAANERERITAVLMFDGRNYTHLLEGPAKAVDATMARIAMDPRHTRMRVLFEQARTTRSYVGFPLSYLHDDTRQALTTELVDGHRALSGEQVKALFPAWCSEEPAAAPY